MKIGYISDLHIDNYVYSYNRNKESPYHPLDNIENDVDVLILAGDLYEYKYIFAHIPHITEIAKKVKALLIVEGNHEYYEGDISTKFDGSIFGNNVFILRNEMIMVDDVAFYGGTFWPNLLELDSLDQFNIRTMISDFSYIKNGDSYISMEYMKNEYDKFIEGLIETQLKNLNKLVVISHMAPSYESVTPRYKNSIINPYFCNSIDDLIKNSNIAYWFHGHVHSHHDYMIGNTRILCNPRGYPSELGQTSEIKYIDI